MAYDMFLPDTSTRRKMSGISEQFAPDINQYLPQLQQYGDAALQKAFGAAQQRLGQQFSPMFRLAQARLGGQPLLADSGYANRLNRQLQGQAFGDLSNAYGDAAAQQAQFQQSALERLIQARIGGQQNILQSIMGSAQKKKNVGDYAGSILGTGAGAFLGGFGSGYGQGLAK